MEEKILFWEFLFVISFVLARNYLSKVSNLSTKTRSDSCSISMLTIFKINDVNGVVLVSLLLTVNTYVTSSFYMSWKYWIMMDYGKTKKSRMKINASIGWTWFMDIDWLISVGSLISICLTRWFDLFNHIP